MTAIDTITAAAASHSDQMIADSIRLIDATLETIADRASEEARTYRMIRAALYSAIETRYPHVIAALDEWATDPEGSDSRSYTEVLLGAANL